MNGLTLNHFLVLGALLFSVGVLCVTLRRNAVGVLIGIEMMLNAANVNLVAFSRWHGNVDGAVYAVFVIMLAAAEAAVALAIIIGIYQNFGRVDVDQADQMRD
jgi:NADH-quinone oxidoreductase subunit K